MPPKKSVKQKTPIKYEIVEKILLRDNQSSGTIPDASYIHNIKILNMTVDEIRLICSNNSVLQIVSKVLRENPQKMKKFCKYVNIYLNNLEKSSQSIVDKMTSAENKLPPSTTKLMDLDLDTRSKILQQYHKLLPKKLVLKDWINDHKDKLDWEELSSNPLAIDVLKDNMDKIKWTHLCYNPKGIELLKQNMHKITKCGWINLSENPGAIELIEAQLKKDELQPDNKRDRMINWESLCLNPNAIHLIKKQLKIDSKKINWRSLSVNPNGTKIFSMNKDYLDKIDWNELSMSITDMKFLKKCLDQNIDIVNWGNLSWNKNAMKILKDPQYKEKIWVSTVSQYPEAIDVVIREYAENGFVETEWLSFNPHPKAIKFLKKYKHEIDWDNLAANTNKEALKILQQKLKENPLDLLDYRGTMNLASNLNAIDLIKEELKRDESSTNVDWSYLSSNPNALEILQNNTDKIDWGQLSINPSIFKEED